MSRTEKVTVAGFGGQGVMLVGQMLAYAGNDAGKNSLWYPSYGPETRGGTANCAVTISDKEIYSPVFSKADTLIIFNGPSMDKFISKMKVDGNLFYNSSLITNVPARVDVNIYPVPMNELAETLGNQKVANMVMLGAYLEVTKLFDDQVIHEVLGKMLKSKPALIDINIKAIAMGRTYIKEKGLHT